MKSIAQDTTRQIDMLNKLNARSERLHRKITKACSACADRDTINAIRAEYKKLHNQMADLQSSITTPVKFNSVSGKFFDASGEQKGTEKFVIRVAKVCTADVIVDAKNYLEAVKKAKRMAEDGAVEWRESYMPFGNMAG